ncbi:ATP-binding protein [Variovorax sp. J22R133]|uniref:sensor histidine kinase n=1 Tax=Variovorax brevis TaxID=3053503 RepID=UPI0025756D7D|nr:ATP-binding protein [Variovorax sp. J22R133]MDM0113697.1 ATP-binding protein [Variovorax sp. J22R133]
MHVRLKLVLLCLLLVAGHAMAQNGRYVLVLYSNGRLVPGNVEVETGLRNAIARSAERPVQINTEFLDVPQFVGATYERMMTNYLHDKYAPESAPAVIVAVGRDALDFVLRQRTQLFPDVPVVHAAVFATFPKPIGPLPEDVVGVPIEYDIIGSIEQALHWHPKATQLLLVTGSTVRDRDWEKLLREKTSSFQESVKLEFLAGVPTAELLKRLKSLDATSLVFTPGFYQSGDELWTTPRDAVQMLAQASAAPVYGPFSTLIGTGAVGGRMPRFADIGQQAGQIVNSLLDGTAPAKLQLPRVMPNRLIVDWRQTQRWGISDADVPADAVVEFRQPTFWESYRTAGILGLAAILLQAALITALMLEHRRRLKAEIALAQRGAELAHASRLAIAGELTASIAHEINQPLAAILSNAEAAELLLKSGRLGPDEMGGILADIRRDDLRASEVISRLRTLLARQVVARQPLDLNAAIVEGCEMLEAEARRRAVKLVVRTGSEPVHVVGDSIQIQQVLINLVLNGMDAIGNLPERRRTLVVSTTLRGNGVELEVSDHGEGVAPENLPKLFDSFFSTKSRGMGLGLSITRTIVEGHGGRIWADSTRGVGTVFHVELPRFFKTSPAPQEQAWA